MSERDTPETDAFYDALYAPNVPEDLRRAVDAQEREYARRLERQRDELADVLADRDAELEKDAGRYAKLRGWMSSGVDEGWNEVQKLAALACYMSWDDFDLYLDALGQCDVGLMYRAAYIPVSEEKP